MAWKLLSLLFWESWQLPGKNLLPPVGNRGAVGTVVFRDTGHCLHLILLHLCALCRDSYLQWSLCPSSLASSSEAPCDCWGDPGAAGSLWMRMPVVPSLCPGPGGLLVWDGPWLETVLGLGRCPDWKRPRDIPASQWEHEDHQGPCEQRPTCCWHTWLQ